MPDWNRYVRDNLSLPELSRQREEEIHEDLAGQFEASYREALTRGASEEEAVAHAKQHIPDWESFVSDVYRSERRNAKPNLEKWHDTAEQNSSTRKGENQNMLLTLANDLWKDLLYGLRLLLKSPGFTAVAVLSLGIGIAVITTVFSLTNAFFLRPLPFEKPEQLVHIWQTSGRTGFTTLRVSVPNYEDWRAQSTSFEDFGGYYYTSYVYNFDNSNRRIRATRLTPNLLPLLGVEPLIGRTFTPEEGSEGKDNVAILSHKFWQTQFGGSQDVQGKTILLDDRAYNIVGVMPESFVLPFNNMDMWVPLPIEPYRNQRASTGPLLVIGRLKPDKTPTGAQAELDTIMQRLEQAYPEDNTQVGANIVDLRSQLLFTYDMFKVVFPALFLAVSFVLLIACTNIGNLLLARATGRSREIALRLALGASPGRLVRQLLTESILLSLFGGAVGVLLAYWVTSFADTAIPGELYRVGSIGVDGATLLFALLVALSTALLFGLAPALQFSHPNLAATLREGDRSGSGGLRSQRLRNALVVTEVALAMVMVAGATLMAQTFLALQRVETGFNPDNILAVELALPRYKYPGKIEINLYFEDALSRIRNLPGVESAAAVYPLPLNHEQHGDSFLIEGRAPATEDRLYLNNFWVTTEYFQTMQIPILQGRAFDVQDAADSQPAVIVNREMAERYWPNESPVGKRIQTDDVWRTIVGVAANSIAFDLNEEPRVLAYYPASQISPRRKFVMVRTQGDPLTFVSSVRNEIQALDPAQPITEIRTMNKVILTWLGAWLMGIAGIGFLGAGALLLASMGIYGVIAYSIGQRTHEFGIRIALGAGNGEILRLVLRQAALLASAGILVGWVVSFALTRFLQTLLFGVEALDPLTFVGAPLLLIAVALLASYIPARRATQVDPMIALRYE
jgi:putative ABC transport system permease protein